MALITSLTATNEPQGSQARKASELANAAGLYAMSRPLVTAALARGGTAAKVKTTADITLMIQGAFYALATTDDYWTLSGTVVAAASWQKYALLTDTSGTASIQEATQSLVSAAAVSWKNVSGMSSWAPFLTMLGATKALVGVLTIATDATHPFTPGTTALNAAGITATFVNGLDQTLLPLLANEQGTLFGNGG